MAPWQAGLLVAFSVGVVAGVIGWHVASRARRKALDELRARAAEEHAALGGVTSDTRHALKAAYKAIHAPRDDDDDVFTLAFAGGLLGLTVALVIMTGLWLVDDWDGSYWPVVQDRPMSLERVEDLASEALESDVTCVEGDGPRRYVCARGRRGARVIRVSESGDRVVIER